MASSTTPKMQETVVSSSTDSESNKMDGDAIIPISVSKTSGMEKEKTPMCLVNELARFNKIEHQYRLTNEEGPPHKKKFTVTLKFGSEEYTAEGPSIKKAQHAAAGIALQKTIYDHPPPKSSRNLRGTKGNITPTVELNALAMKRGEPTTYTLVESPHFNEFNGYVAPFASHRGMYTSAFSHYSYGYRGKPSFRGVGGYNPRGVDPRFFNGKPPLYKVMVKVGERAFSGEGITTQAARHDAASKALQLLQTLPIQEQTTNSCPKNSTCDFVDNSDSTTEIKSPISLVHEIALKKNLHVLFEVIDEKGPPHMRTFVTRCCVGDSFESIGEGNGKKVSKKRAAEKMLDRLRPLPPASTAQPTAGCLAALNRIKKKPSSSKKKSRNLIKDTTTVVQEPKFEPDTQEDMNPISKLMQIQQSKREREPVYTLREERGLPRKREFIMEVKMGDHSFVASGPNKKMAKRNAAEGLLRQLGYLSATVSETGEPLPLKQVRFSDEKQQTTGGSVGRQLVPGVLLMTSEKTVNGNQPHKSPANIKTTAAIAKEYLSNGNSPTADALGGQRPKTVNTVRPTEQLRYLGNLLDFHVQFSDFPKGNHSEYLTLVSLNTDPPQVCHGSGTTRDKSQDQASLNALRVLSDMGLDSISPAKKEQTAPSVSSDTIQTDNLYINIKEDTPFVNGK